MNASTSSHRPAYRTVALTSLAWLLAAAQVLAGEQLVRGATPRAPLDRTVRSMVVHIGDLTLSGPAGVRALHARISGAARTVCGYEGRSLLEQGEWRQCYHGAVANALAAVDGPLLGATHRGDVRVTALLR